MTGRVRRRTRGVLYSRERAVRGWWVVKSSPICMLLCVSLFNARADAQNSGLTIYNQNFAVVRQTLKLDLRAGITPVEFTGITARLEPESVVLRDPLGKRALTILEQNYQPDPVSQEALLNKFEGQTIDFLVGEQVVKGKIIRSGRQATNSYYQPTRAIEPIIEVNGRLRFGIPGIPAPSNLGANATINPTLSWKLETPTAGPLTTELSYVTGGMTWRADYNLVTTEPGRPLELVGWVTMENNSGHTFENARIKLMAGDVNKVAAQPAVYARVMVADQNDAAAPVVTSRAFDEYHLYTLERPSTLRDHEVKQVEFLSSNKVQAVTEYVYDGLRWTLGPNYGYDYVRQTRDVGLDSQPKVAVMQTIVNSKANGLGLPLPKGRVRFYRRDTDGQLELTGENNIDHTPSDETLRIFTGNAFDLVGERKRTNFTTSGSSSNEESFEIRVRNHKSTAVDVTVVEHLFRWTTWTITSASQYKKVSSNQIEIPVSVPANGERVITYTVRYSW